MLNNLRKDINEIDNKMIELFKERMEVVKKILIYKKENDLSVVDEKREIKLIEDNIKLLNDKNFEKYYKIFFEGVLQSSKKYQEDNL